MGGLQDAVTGSGTGPPPHPLNELLSSSLHLERGRLRPPCSYRQERSLGT